MSRISVAKRPRDQALQLDLLAHRLGLWGAVLWRIQIDALCPHSLARDQDLEILQRTWWFLNVYNTKKYEDHVLHLGWGAVTAYARAAIAESLASTCSLQLFHPNPKPQTPNRLLSYPVSDVSVSTTCQRKEDGRRTPCTSCFSKCWHFKHSGGLLWSQTCLYIDLSRFWSRFAFPKPAYRLRHAKTTTLHVIHTLYTYTLNCHTNKYVVAEVFSPLFEGFHIESTTQPCATHGRKQKDGSPPQ